MYLISIVAGDFAIGVAPAILIVSRTAATAAQHRGVRPPYYRSGIAIHVLVVLTNIPWR